VGTDQFKLTLDNLGREVRSSGVYVEEAVFGGGIDHLPTDFWCGVRDIYDREIDGIIAVIIAVGVTTGVLHGGGINMLWESVK
jgi:hypothetical protein